jgi:hypothetical protein
LVFDIILLGLRGTSSGAVTGFDVSEKNDVPTNAAINLRAQAFEKWMRTNWGTHNKNMPFTPPSASAGPCQGIPFQSAVDVAAENKRDFDAFDETPRGKGDPSKCKALLKFLDGTIFWSSKMAIDADGPAAGPGRLSGSQLDAGSGQDDTTFHFKRPNRGLSSETMPYIVLPGGTFRKNTGLSMGDVAVVIFKDKITEAICGDVGPTKKIGEGSIRLHEALHPPAPDPCSLRNPDGNCKRILNASIEEDVLFFAFANSSFGDDLTPANLESKVKERAFTLFNRLRQASWNTLSAKIMASGQDLRLTGTALS